MEELEYLDDVERIYNKIVGNKNDAEIISILTKELSFKIAKDFFEGVEGKGEVGEKVRNVLCKHGNKNQVMEESYYERLL